MWSKVNFTSFFRCFFNGMFWKHLRTRNFWPAFLPKQVQTVFFWWNIFWQRPTFFTVRLSSRGSPIPVTWVAWFVANKKMFIVITSKHNVKLDSILIHLMRRRTQTVRTLDYIWVLTTLDCFTPAKQKRTSHEAENFFEIGIIIAKLLGATLCKS